MRENYESHEVPGIGEINSRRGTSTTELAGAASFWHKKYQDARKDGFIAAVTLMAALELIAVTIYHYWSH